MQIKVKFIICVIWCFISVIVAETSHSVIEQKKLLIDYLNDLAQSKEVDVLPQKNVSEAIHMVRRYQKQNVAHDNDEHLLVKSGLSFISIKVYSQNCFSGEVKLNKTVFLSDKSQNSFSKLVQGQDIKDFIFMKEKVWKPIIRQARLLDEGREVLGGSLNTSPSLVVITIFQDRCLKRIIALDPWEYSGDKDMERIEIMRLNFFIFLIQHTDYSKFLPVKSSFKYFDRSYDFLIERLKEVKMNWFEAYSKLFPEEVQ